MRKFVIVTKDGEKFTIEERLARTLGRVKSIIKKENMKTGREIVLDKVDSAVLHKVLEWTHHHRRDIKVPENDEEDQSKDELEVSPWDQTFLKVDFETLFKIIQASIYLDVKGLRKLTCRSAAQIFKGKSAEEIRTILNIKNDFSPAEQAMIMAESA